MYRVVRLYFNRPGFKRVIATGLSLKEAQAHCHDPETSSSTAASAEGKRRTKQSGPWFDAYEEER